MNNKIILSAFLVGLVLYISSLFLPQFLPENVSDKEILYSATFLTLALILFSFQNNKRFALINLVVFFVYSARFYYGLYYQSEGGSGLVWLFYILLVTAIHFLFVLIYSIVKFWKK